jgi:ATP-dependent NAD(P)H-hydrate dehydratase
LIVHPYLRTTEKLEDSTSIKDIVDRVSNVFSRLHVLVVGPGLSRDQLMQDSAKLLIEKAREEDMSIVIDADGLYLVQTHPETIQGYRKAILTPNVVEFQRLCEKMVCVLRVLYILLIIYNRALIPQKRRIWLST